MAIVFNGTSIRDRVRKAAMRGVVRGTEAVRNEAVSLILNTPKTGRMYKRRSVEHQASAPGEAPASNTGRLVNGIETQYDFPALSGKVVSTAEYGPYLEYGTKNMEPRPYMRPALANKKDDIKRFVQEEITEEFK